MARRARRRKPRRQKTTALQLSDYQYPGEKKQYWQSVGIITGLFVWVAVMGLWLSHGLWTYQWAYLAAWPIGSLLIVNFLAARPRRKQLKQVGRQSKVMGNNHPQLHRLLTEQCQVLGLSRPPDMYVLDEESPYMYSFPGKAGTVIVTKPMLEVLSDEEFATLLAHELGHIKSHHLHLALAMIYVENLNPLLQLVFGPVAVWVRLMGAWRDVIDYTADRLSLLVTRNPAVLMRAIVKSAAATDEQADLSQEEIEAYLASGADLETDAAQMERFFKISQFVKNQPNLRDRIEEIREYSASEEAQAALEKIAQILQEPSAPHSPGG